jgi:hypothetical protein
MARGPRVKRHQNSFVCNSGDIVQESISLIDTVNDERFGFADEAAAKYLPFFRY